MTSTRRSFLQATGLVATVAATGIARRAAAAEPDWGEIIRPEEGYLAVPEGFTVTLLQSLGDTMSDGYRVPGRPDGMACFEDADGNWVLLRNHELSGTDRAESPFPEGVEPPEESFDPDEVGGVTRLVIDPETLAVLSSNLVLTGTVRNCAGGPSPWGWLSCEESVTSGHGYVFRCPVDADRVAPPEKIDAYGRFNHEAVAIDPNGNVAYLTEDRGDSALYRFVPDDPAEPFGAGRLQAMVVADADAFDTSADMAVGDVVAITWVDIEETDPPADTMRFEARGKGAALVRRGEGIWFHGGVVWVCSTSGGPTEGGQIFRLDPAAGTLELVARSESRLELDMPDNVAVAPWGQVFMSEDGLLPAHVRAIARDGSVVTFARNVFSPSELAGVCFSPDGSTMFVNIQVEGLTLAVQGPWPRWEEGAASADGGAVATDDTDSGEAPAPKRGCDGVGGAGLGWAAITLAALGLRARRSAAGEADQN